MLGVFAASVNLLSNDDGNISERDYVRRCDKLRFLLKMVEFTAQEKHKRAGVFCQFVR